MMWTVQTIKGFTLNSHDGEIGQVRAFYFDDQHWTIRYLVADSGTWLTGRQVLISPHALTDVHIEKKHITVDLTKKQIEDSPSLDSDKPVSQQFEKAYYGYFGYPMYWAGPYLWGQSPYPVLARAQGKPSTPEESSWDVHLRSTHVVRGYHIESADGSIGYVDDFIVENETWAIRYLVINTRSWLPGKKVLVSPHWIERVSWSESKVFVNLSGEAIKQSPEYTEESLLTRDYETRLHGHYNRQGYWVAGPSAKRHSS